MIPDEVKIESVIESETRKRVTVTRVLSPQTNWQVKVELDFVDDVFEGATITAPNDVWVKLSPSVFSTLMLMMPEIGMVTQGYRVEAAPVAEVDAMLVKPMGSFIKGDRPVRNGTDIKDVWDKDRFDRAEKFRKDLADFRSGAGTP